MKFLDYRGDGVIIELTRHELHLANMLIQEGRISFECDSPDGQKLEDSIRSIVIRLEESLKAGLAPSATH